MKLYQKNVNMEGRDRGDPPAQVLAVESIRFDQGGDAVRGGIYFRKNHDTELKPEFKPAAGSMEIKGAAAVYVPKRLKEPELTIKVKNKTPAPVTASLRITVVMDGAPAPLEIVLPERVFNAASEENVSVKPDAAQYKNMLGDRFEKKKSTWAISYTIAGQSAEAPMLAAECAVYTLLDLPIQPWMYRTGAYNQFEVGYVWLDLLDQCDKAVSSFTAGPGLVKAVYSNAQEAFLAGITLYLNTSKAFRYDTAAGACHYINVLGEVKLKKFLADLNDESKRSPINCLDCANILVIQALAAGVPVNVGRLINPVNNLMPAIPYGFIKGFKCNQIIPVGCDAETPSWQAPFGTGYFSYHAVMVSDDMYAEDTTQVFDACLKIDKGLYPGGTDVSVKEAFVPVYYTFSPGNGAFVDVPEDKPYAGSYYRERLAADGQECVLSARMERPCGMTGDLTAIRKEKYTAKSRIRPNQEQSGIIEYYGIGQSGKPAAACAAPVKEHYFPPYHQVRGIQKVELVEDSGKEKSWVLKSEGTLRITVDAFRADDKEEAVAVMGVMLSRIETCDIVKNIEHDCDDAFEIGGEAVLYRDRNLVCMVNGNCGLPIVWDICESIIDYNNI